MLRVWTWKFNLAYLLIEKLIEYNIIINKQKVYNQWFRIF